MRAVIPIVVALLTLLPQSSRAVEVVKNDDFQLNVDGRLQLLGFGQYLDDHHRSDARVYLFMKQARLGATGKLGELEFRTALAFGGEEITASSGVALGLLDMYVDVPVGPVRLRAGQFKIPYSRERLTDSGQLRFGDRSLQNLGFRFGRDVGVAAHTELGNFVGGAGVFVGGGRDVPERYLPQRLGSPVVALRLGYSGGIAEDVFTDAARKSTLGETAPRWGAFLNGLYVKDSLVGHSSVLNVRLGERSMLSSSAWNPYVGQAPLNQGQLWQVGADAVIEHPIAAGTARLEVEANHGQYGNDYGQVVLTGGRAQLGYERKGWSAAVRYAFIKPSSELAIGGTQITGGRPFSEITPAITFRLNDNVKVVMDAPVLLNVPVVMENTPAVGAYVLTEQMDQTSVIKNGGTVARQTVLEGRMLLQANF